MLSVDNSAKPPRTPNDFTTSPDLFVALAEPRRWEIFLRDYGSESWDFKFLSAPSRRQHSW